MNYVNIFFYNLSFSKEDLVCLNSLAGGMSTALKEIIGEYMKLHILIEVKISHFSQMLDSCFQ